MLTDRPILVCAMKCIQFLSLLRKQLLICQFSVSFFHWSPSTGKHRITPVSFAKTMESYEALLSTINWQTLYDSGKTTKSSAYRLGHHLSGEFTRTNRDRQA